MADSAVPGTTVHSALSSATTSNNRGGAGSSTNATTSRESIRRSFSIRFVWKYSGHEATFHDPLVDCRECKIRMRADKIREMVKCPNAVRHNLDGTAPFQHDVPHALGAAAEDDPTALAYLRPETAQGIFINFLNVQTTMRRKIPFGIAQVGKSFRNEITPGNFILRTREFEQMEMEYFVKPDAEQFQVSRRMG